MATLLVFNSSSKVAFGDLSQARPWNWCNLKSGRRIAARAQIPMTSGIRCPTMKTWGRVEVWEAFVQYCRNRLVTVKAIEEKNDDIIRIIENRPSKDQIEVTSLHSTKRKNLLVPTFRIQSFARKNVGMLNVSFWPLPNWHKAKTWGMYLKLFHADFQGFM